MSRSTTRQHDEKGAAAHAAAAAVAWRPTDRVEKSEHAALRWLTQVGGNLAALARSFGRQFLASLHETRRRQAAIALTRHRPVIFDADTGIALRPARTAGRTHAAGSD